MEAVTGGNCVMNRVFNK